MCGTMNLLLLLFGSVFASQLPNRPNIVFIVSDDQGYQDVGFRGSDILTPNLDQLASEGVILENHYVMPQCSPTRASLMSGRHAIRTGFWHGNIKPTEEWGLRLDETTMPEMLKRNGYATHGVGKWHCGMYTEQHTPANRGFDTFMGLYLGAQDYYKHINRGCLDLRMDYRLQNGTLVDNMRYDLHGLYNTDFFTERAISVISEHDPSTPLFLYLGYTAPHGPIQAPDTAVRQYTSHMKGSKMLRRKYATMVSLMDRGVGQVVDALEQYGLRKDTLIVFMSDNGAVYGGRGSNFPLRGGKTSLQEGGVRSISIVNSPLLQKTGYINTNLHHVTDWYATFQALAGDHPEQVDKKQLDVDGLNIWESISLNKSSGREEVLINMRMPEKMNQELENQELDNQEEDNMTDNDVEEVLTKTDNKAKDFFVIRRGDWKLFSGSSYIFNDWTEKNCEKRAGKDSKMGSGVKLYNLASDTREMYDVSEDFPDIVQELLAKAEGYGKNVTVTGKRSSSGAGKVNGEWHPWVTTVVN